MVTAMLKAGVALGKIDSFRDLLEENGFALTSSTNLRQLVPFILQEELSQLKQEVCNKHVSDGTTHVCEAMVVVLRYVTNDWVIKQKVNAACKKYDWRGSRTSNHNYYLLNWESLHICLLQQCVIELR